MKSLFVIPCKYSDSVPFIYNCLDSIRKYHDDKIVVVDSDSPNRNYLNVLQKKYFNLEILDIKNQNFMTGAIWSAYKEYNYENYYFLHDSTELLGNLSEYEKYKVAPILTKHISLVSRNLHWARIKGKRSPRWAVEKLKNTSIEFDDEDFNIIVGPMFMAQRLVLDRLKSMDFDKILPTCKTEMEMMERVWGIAFKHLGLKFGSNIMLKGPGRFGSFRKRKKISLRNYEMQRDQVVEVRTFTRKSEDKIIKYWVGRK
jgi:hypothetical protein